MQLTKAAYTSDPEIMDVTAPHERILIARLNRSKYYQGEEPDRTFSESDNSERFNFRRSEDGRFYGSIPRYAPEKEGEWLVVFIASGDDDEDYAVGWYENATFEKGPVVRPEYEYNPHMPLSKNQKLTYTVHSDVAYLLPPNIRPYFKVPKLKPQPFGRTPYIYVRGPGAEDREPWRQEFANFAEQVVAGDITRTISASA